jgi:hypothetical protein
VCVWARQIRQLRLTIPRSSALCVVCTGRFPRGVPGGGGGGGQVCPPWLRNVSERSAPKFVFGQFLLFLAVL